jgi:hypothetical protein
MQGVLKLTAGTSDELGSALAGAAPKLLEIAKASNKLNPALGDTAFLYDSISTGIKRASPLILDNLGIVVKVGEANKTYADQLGKTVAALTAEEKQMALLNATIAAGDTLISQVGGNVDSATDSYAQLEVGIANVTNELKILAAEGLGPVVGFLNEQVTQGGLFEELERVTDSQEKAIEVGNILFRTYEDHAHINAIVAKAVEIAGDNHELSAAQLVEYAEAALLADQNAENLVRGYQALVGETRDYTIAQSGVNALLRDVIPLSVDAEAALNEYNRTIASGAGTTNDYALAQISLKQRLEDLRPAIDDAKNAILGIREPLGLETGRAAFEIFVEANEAKAEIEDFQSELDGLEDFHKTELQVEDEAARAALEDYAAGAERLSIEANLDTNVDEALSDAEVINREYDKIEEERLTHFETNAEEVINIQVTPLQDAYGETPEEIITEFQTPGLDEALEETRRLQERLGQLPSQKDISFHHRKILL